MEEFYKDALDLIEERSDALFAQRVKMQRKQRSGGHYPQDDKARESAGVITKDPK